MSTMSAWVTEDNIVAQNICDLTPELLYDRFVWDAIRESFDISVSANAALNALVEWNKDNSPAVPQKELVKKFIWALVHFDHVPFPRKLGK